MVIVGVIVELTVQVRVNVRVGLIECVGDMVAVDVGVT
jgi:hypothetical protein